LVSSIPPAPEVVGVDFTGGDWFSEGSSAALGTGGEPLARMTGSESIGAALDVLGVRIGSEASGWVVTGPVGHAGVMTAEPVAAGTGVV
jgi:hypothetical protein